MAIKAAQIVTLLPGAGLYGTEIGFFGRKMALLHKYRALLGDIRSQIVTLHTVVSRFAPWGRSLLKETLTRTKESQTHRALLQNSPTKMGLFDWRLPLMEGSIAERPHK